MAPVIEAQQLSIAYRLDQQWIDAITDITLQIQASEIHGLVGESGSGKSTLALALMNYMAANARATSGHVLFDGTNLLDHSLDDMRRIWGKDLNLVPQDSLAALNPSHRVGDQIAEISQLHMGLSRQAAWARAIDLLREVKIADPEAVCRRFPHQLSGGMQQRVTIAMALSTQPRLLILDEPTTALDVTTQAVILDLVRELIRNHQAAALYVSHDLGTVAQLCDHVTVLYAGEIMESAAVSDLFAQPLHPYTSGLLASLPRRTEGNETRLFTIEGTAPALGDRPSACVFAPRCPVALEICWQEKPPLETTANTQRSVRCHRWEEIASGELSLQVAPQSQAADAPARQQAVLDAQNINKQFGEIGLLDRIMGHNPRPIRAVDDVSIRIQERSTFGLVGESGSGKTTLARCIVALTEADSGEMTLCELPLSKRLVERDKASLRNLQMIFQSAGEALNPYQSIGQALARPLRLLADEALSETEIQQRVTELLAAVRLTPEYAARYPAELSGGEKQRIAIARAFASNPALVLADEPTSSLDVSVQAVILNLLKDLRARQSASYLLISHDLEVIAYLADWIAVMYLGHIVEEGSNEAVYNPPWHPYTEALLDAIPLPDPDTAQGNIRLQGDVPSASDIPSGCRFHTRCPRFLGDICVNQEPPWRDAGDGHFIRCHIPIEELTTMQQEQD